MLKTIEKLNPTNKTVLLRTDYNVPLERGRVTRNESWRIDATLSTLNLLIKRKNKIIILCHLGRPQGKEQENLRLKPIASFLAKKLNRRLVVFKDKSSLFPQALNVLTKNIYFLSNNVAASPEKMKTGDILMLENIRFHPQEQKPKMSFAKALARLGDVFINDAFATAHRKASSITLLPKIMPSAAGLLMEKEIDILGQVKNRAKKPLILIMGGAKAQTKTELIKAFLSYADAVLVGGVLANTLLAAQGIAIGKSIVDKTIEQELNNIEITSPRLHLPVDVIACPDKKGKGPISVAPVGKIAPKDMILDIGPDTVSLFSSIISRAKTIIWNGPLGYAETKKFSQGSVMLLQEIAKNPKVYTILGGGETIALAAKHHLLEKIDFISTGGGAMLKLLAGETLPGIKALTY